MDDKDKKVIGRIIEHGESIILETKDLKNAENFKNNNTKSKSAFFDLLQIGELAKNGLSKDFIEDNIDIPWKNIYALRNRIVHGYAYVDYEIIWETIKKDIPELVKKLKSRI